MTREADDLTRTVAAWATMATETLGGQRLEIAQNCLLAPDVDLRVVVCLRAGTITLEGSNETFGKRVLLFEEHVHGLRPATGFAAVSDQEQ